MGSATVEGKKYDQGKPPMDLLPPGPLFLLARLYAEGAKKYEPYNWRKGMEWSRVYAALLRHVMAWWDGHSIDPEFGLSHLVHALWNAVTLVCYEAEGLGTDDRPCTRQGEDDG